MLNRSDLGEKKTVPVIEIWHTKEVIIASRKES